MVSCVLNWCLNCIIYIWCLACLSIFQFKAKSYEIKPDPLCLGIILKDFKVNYLEKTGLKEFVYNS